MVQDVTAVVGISGVGKTTAIEKLKLLLPLVHLSASELLKLAFLRAGKSVSSENLRLGSIGPNQELLIEEFARQSGAAKLPVVFDGHILIEGRNGIEFIESKVFQKLRVARFIVLSAPAEKIFARRSADQSRDRPPRALLEIERLQELYIERSMEVARQVDVPAYVFSEGDQEGILSVMPHT